jgi:hypothetical protein
LVGLHLIGEIYLANYLFSEIFVAPIIIGLDFIDFWNVKKFYFGNKVLVYNNYI